MKTMRILVIIFVLLVPGILFAQHTICYDFNTNTFSHTSKNDACKSACKCFEKGLPKNFEEKNEYKISVKNINRFLYDVSINTKTQTYVSNPIAITGTVVGNLTQLVGEFQKVSDMLKILMADGNAKISSNGCSANVISINAKLVELIATEFKLQENLRITYKSVICEDDIKKIKNSDDLLKIASKQLSDIDVLVKQLDPSDNECFKNILAQYTSLDYHSKLTQYAKIIVNLNASAFEYESPPTIAEGEFATISINISPKKFKDGEVIGIPLRKDSIVAKIPVFSKKGKLSFSTGFFIDKIQNGDTYGYKPTVKNDTINGFNLVRENTKNIYNIGISSFAHYMWPWDLRDQNLSARRGFFMGLGLPFQKSPNLRVALGGSIAFGKKEQLLLNFGYAGTTIKVPSSLIGSDIVDGKFLFKDMAYVIPYVNKVSGEWFFSVTFNVFELK